MKQNISLLKRFISLFGLKYGTQLFISFKLKKLSNIRLPNLKTSISLRNGTSDIPSFFQVFVYKEYDINFISHPKIIIDGGANIGLFSVLMKNKFPDAKIISIEPDKDNYALLRKNVSSYKNIYCENCGLWIKRANLKISDKYKLGKWAMIVEETKDEGDTKAISMNDLMKKYSIERIDILKIDIETSERILFSDNYENWLPKVKMIIIELHDWMEDGCSKPFFVAINKVFSKYKYLISGDNTIIINNDID